MSNRTLDRNQAMSHDRSPFGGPLGKRGRPDPAEQCSVQSERKHRALGRLQNSSSGTTEARHLASFLKRVFDRTRRSGKLLPRWRGTMFCSLRSWAISSGGEHYLDTVGVTSSNLVSPTMKDQVIGCFSRWPFLFPKPEGTLRTQSGRIARTHAPPPASKIGIGLRSPAISSPPAELPCRSPTARIATELERSRKDRSKRLLRSSAPARRATSDRTASAGTSAHAPSKTTRPSLRPHRVRAALTDR